jgi:predicted metal-dependent hydrolase
MIESTEPRRGRTAPLDEAQADRLFRQGVSLFNGVRYWHAHEAWETLWRAATDDERDFYQGLIQLAAGLLHLERRNLRGARNKLAEGIERLRPYRPTHRDIAVSELIGACEPLLSQLQSGYLPYLIPPSIKYVDIEPDWSR